MDQIKQEFFNNLAAESMPENFDEIVATFRKTFREFFFLGVTNDPRGIAFSSCNISTPRLASAIAEMCKKNPAIFPMIAAFIQNSPAQSADVSQTQRHDPLSDDIIGD